MNQVPSLHTNAKRTQATPQRPGTTPSTPVRVPALDWPGNLFSDNVSPAEIAAEEFEFAWEEPVRSWGYQSPEMLREAA